MIHREGVRLLFQQEREGGEAASSFREELHLVAAPMHGVSHAACELAAEILGVKHEDRLDPKPALDSPPLPPSELPPQERMKRMGLRERAPKIIKVTELPRAVVPYASVDPAVSARVYAYAIPQFNIYGSTPQHCLELYGLYRALEKSELGRVIQQLLLENVQTGRLCLLAHPGSLVGRSMGLFGQGVVRGVAVHQGIILPMKPVWIARQMTWCHEVTHFFVSCLITSADTCPIVDLPRQDQLSFMEKYQRAQAQFSRNPHLPGTSSWKVHEFINRQVFQHPVRLYPASKHASEIVAHAMQFELSHPGLFLRHCPPDLQQALREVLFERQPLPKVFQEHLPLPRSIPRGDYITLDQFNRAQPLSALSSITRALRSVGNGILRALRVVNHPAVSLPVHMAFSYDPTSEEAVSRAIRDGTAIWTLGTSMTFLFGSTLGAPFTLVLGVGSVGAELAPDFMEMAASLPKAEELLVGPEMSGLTSLGRIALMEQLGRASAGMRMMGALQKGLQALNPVRIWDFLKKRHLPEQWHREQLEHSFSEAEHSLKVLEEFVVQELVPYLNECEGSSGLQGPLQNPASVLLPPSFVGYNCLVQPFQPDFTSCTFDWSVNPENHLDAIRLEASLEIPEADLEALAPVIEFVEAPPNPNLEALAAPSGEDTSSSPPPLDKLKEPPKPGFGELAKITDLRVGAAIGGGAGVVATLASGGMVSIGLSESGGVIIGLSAPLNGALLPALGTGLLYAAPIAAVLIGIQLYVKHQREQVIAHLKRDYREQVRELNQLKYSLEEFQGKFEQFAAGEIDLPAFISKVNQVIARLIASENRGDDRGRYASHHHGTPFDYFASSSRLKQLELDLRELTLQMLTQEKVNREFAPALKMKNFEELCHALALLSGQKVVSFEGFCRQQALQEEITLRLREEKDLCLFEAVEALSVLPTAIHLEASDVAKPSHISADNIKGHHHKRASSESRRDRLKRWADSLNEAYQHFVYVSKNFTNLNQLQEAANRVRELIGKAQPGGGLDLSKYNLVDFGCKTALEYYSSYLASVEKEVGKVLLKASAAEAGKVNEQIAPLFSPEELAVFKFNAALALFESASRALDDPDAALEEKEAAYRDRLLSSSILIGLKHLSGQPHQLEELLQPIVEMSRECRSYAEYTIRLERLGRIADLLRSFHNATEKWVDKEKKLSEAERKNELQTACDMAKDLLALNPTREEIDNLLEKGKESQEIFDQLIKQAQEVIKAHALQGYEDQIQLLYSPGTRLFLHFFQDLQRFEGYERLKLPTRIAAALHGCAPELLPAALALPAAHLGGDGALMKEALHGKITMRFDRICKAVTQPREAWQRAASLSKKVHLIQGANAAVQLTATLITSATQHFFHSTRQVEAFNRYVEEGAKGLNACANLAHYTHLGTKLHKYCRLGTLGAKYHKIGAGVAGLALSLFDLYEFMATELDRPEEQSEWGFSDRFKGTLKEWLPKFHGNLPEEPNYYLGKDGATLLLYGVGIEHPLMAGLFLYQGAATLYNFASERYLDDALCGMMLNQRYYVRQGEDAAAKRAFNASLSNMASLLDYSWKFQSGDSKIKQQAKRIYFQETLHRWHREESWMALLNQSILKFNAAATSCVFMSCGSEAFELLPLLHLRFCAALRQSDREKSYGLENFSLHMNELDKARRYCSHKFAALPERERAKNQGAVQETERTFKRMEGELRTTYLLHREDYESLLRETRLVEGIEPNDVRFENGVPVAESPVVFFRRCEAYHHQISQGPGGARALIKEVIAEIKKVALSLAPDQGLEPVAAKVGKSGAAHHLRTEMVATFVSCYCAYYVKEDKQPFGDLWELFEMLDEVPDESRNVLHFYALMISLSTLKEEVKGEDPRFWQLTSIQRACFKRIREEIDKKENGGVVLSEFEQSLREHAEVFAIKMKQALPEGALFSDFAQLARTYSLSALIRAIWKGEEMAIAGETPSGGYHGGVDELLRLFEAEQRASTFYDEHLKGHFFHREVLADGNCLFSSIVQQLYPRANPPEWNQQMLGLRNEIADYLERRKEEYASRIEGDFEMHLKHLRESAAGKSMGLGWGEYLHVQVVSQMMQRPIQIFTPDDPWPAVSRERSGMPVPGEHYYFAGDGDPLYLFYNGFNHWSWLKPKG